MGKLKICIVSLRSLPLFDESYSSENVIGGSEINLYNLALCFSEKKNIETKVLVDDFGQPEVYKKDSIELIRFGSNARKVGLISRVIAAFKTYKKLFSIDAEAFIFTSSHHLLGILVLFQQIIKRKKVLFRLSSDLNIDLDSYKKKNGRLSYIFYKFGIKHASVIISQTQLQKNLLEIKLGLKSVIIENGFPIKKHTDIKEKKYILWVGRCMKSKRPMFFVELAKCFPKEEFIMIMPRNKEIPSVEFKEREELEKKVYSNAKGLKNLKMIDYVAFNEIQEYFNKAKLYVCTSELEGFPNTFIQACLGGAPILTYKINPDYMIQKYQLGCFCDDNRKKALIFIRKFDQASLLQYQEGLSNYVTQKHNIFDTAKKYLELIDKNFEVEAED